ncbi:MAG: peptidoglycan bridge formation glycyltransferase FemA/FemB family protein [Calditrichaeota bacterium]|nr:peptidoglycan bridge formation glycyltransferase FemA/FemB family protein [Calditrichota bacterium]
MLAESYGYAPAFFLSRVGVGREIDFLLPVMEVRSRLTGRRGIALPFTDFCAPFAVDQKTFKGAFQEIIAHGKNRGWKFLEIRGGKKFLTSEQPSLTYFNHRLHLSSEEEMYKKFSQGHRRNIKKAKKNSLEICFENSLTSVEEFYRLNCLTRRKHGLPPQPKMFFENFYQFLVAENLATIVSARKENKTIAASVFLHFNGKVTYKYGASDPRYLNLRANHLVMWEAIKYFAERGFRTFGFGKTENTNQGLRRFKLGFGTEEEEISYYKFSFSQNKFIVEENPESGWHTVVFRKSPLPLLKLIGKILYRHVA